MSTSIDHSDDVAPRRPRALGWARRCFLLALAVDVVALVTTLYLLAVREIPEASLVTGWINPTTTLPQILMPPLVALIVALGATPAGIAAYLTHVGHSRARTLGWVSLAGTALLFLLHPLWLLNLLVVSGGIALLHTPGLRTWLAPTPTAAPIPVATPPAPGSVEYGPLPRYQDIHA